MITPIILLMIIVTTGTAIAVGVNNILHAVLGLAITLLGIAGFFLVLNSPFVAAMEILIYVGGISVAMIFAIMLSSITTEKASSSPRWTTFGGLIAAAFALSVGSVIVKFGLPSPNPGPPDPQAWSVQEIGRALLNQYNLVFEVLSIVLLLAIVGAIVMSAKIPKKEAQG